MGLIHTERGWKLGWKVSDYLWIGTNKVEIWDVTLILEISVSFCWFSE